MEKPTQTRQSSWRLRPGERRVLIFLGDFILAWVALAIAVYIWAVAQLQELPLLEFIQARLHWFFLLPIIWVILLIDSYDSRTSIDWRRTVRSIGVSAVIGLFIYLVVFFVSDTSLPRRGVAAFLAAASLFTLMWRFVYIQIFSGPRFMHNVMIVGAGETGTALVGVINKNRPPFNLIGLLDDDLEKQGTIIKGYKVLGTSKQLHVLAEANRVSEIIVAISGKMNPSTFQLLIEAQEKGILITRMPVAYEEMLERVPVQYLEADWILRSFVDQARVNSFYTIGKRLLDLVGGLVGTLSLIVLAPLISLAILIESGRPIVFQQTRAGKGGVYFKILKFRTMKNNKNQDEITRPASEHDQRVTKLGRILRKTHLDETLQFINVLRGDMSLVGPRPETPTLVDHFQAHVPFYRARLLVKPGITGWAQNHINYAANIEETTVKLEYDLYYIKHRTFMMDIGIILRTFAAVFGFRGR
ncbi:MAG: exopolysaccharide biosynthesis polyprenyl glycosylphosphotransferase [Anaerolineales bacterium]